MGTKSIQAYICNGFPRFLHSRCLPLVVECALSPWDSPLTCQRQHTPPSRSLSSLANCQSKWDGRLILWRVWITLIQPRSSTDFSFSYWEKCLCGDQGLNHGLGYQNLCNSLTTSFSCHLFGVISYVWTSKVMSYYQGRLSKFSSWAKI